jgi:DNA-binding IclR family transcriptional regulator
MPSIDKILSLLTDDKWHDLEEITKKADVPLANLEKVVSFLTEYRFVQLSQTSKQVKLEPDLLKFLTELERLEQETSK